MASIVVINDERKEEIELPADMNIFIRRLKQIGFSDDEIINRQTSIEECNTGIEYVDKIVNKFKRINILDLDYLYKFTKKINEEEIKEYNAILKYEYERDNIKDVKELINILFERNCYIYVENVKDFNDLAIKMIRTNEEVKNLTPDYAKEVFESFNRGWNGRFDVYNETNGYVACCNKSQINKRKEINEYRFRDWDGNVIVFKTDIITALGVANYGQGTLYKDKELLFTIELGYYDLLEVYKNLTGRKPYKMSDYETSEDFGIVPATLGHERIKEYSIVVERMNEEEFDG